MTISLPDLRVVVCDDHALFRRGLVMELDETVDIEVVAEASTGEEAVDLAAALGPDLVLMDVSMPGIGGIEATRRIVDAVPSTRILMLTVSANGDDLFEAVKAGAAGYLLKETSIRDIARAARAVAAGHSFLSPPMARRLLDEFSAIARRSAEGDRRAPSLLTELELVVLEALASGADDAAAAADLGVPTRVVKNHVRNILGKLELHTRTEAVLYAMRERMITP